MYCINHPDRIVEGRTQYCASCNRLERKAAAIKPSDNASPINKRSESQSKLLTRYAYLKGKFINGRWCGVHGRPCTPTDIHHTRGRGVGFEDSWAEENNVPRLLDVRFWLPVCRSAHKQIEENPHWAKENGYSESRLSIKE